MVKSVKFNGSSDAVSASSLASNSASFLFSGWVRFDGLPSSGNQYIFNAKNSGDILSIFTDSSGALQVLGYNASYTSILTHTSAAVFASNTGSFKWYHILISVDTSISRLQFYVNDVSMGAGSIANDSFGFGGVTSASFAKRASEYADIAMSEVYLAVGQSLDLSNSVNRRKFIDSNGLPVSLGSDGSTPTGSAPTIYLSGGKTDFQNNKGTGPAFSVTGSLKTASTTPSDALMNAVTLGSSEYLTLGGALSGVVDGKSGLLSLWIQSDVDSTTQVIFGSTPASASTTRVRLQKNSGNTYSLICKNSSGTTILSMSTGGTYLASAKWIHILAAWDLATGAGFMYINDTSDLAASPTLTNDTIDYAMTSPNWAIAASISGGSVFAGSFAEVYFAPNQYLDISNVTNRRKFIDANGLPVALGTDGSTPTGTAPALLLSNPAYKFFANKGSSGGTFTSTTPSYIDAHSSPSFFNTKAMVYASTSKMALATDLTGVADSKTGTVSMHVKFTSSGTEVSLLSLNNDNLVVKKYSNDCIYINGLNVGLKLSLKSIGTYGVSDVYHHVLVSWDLNAGIALLYIDGADDLDVSPTKVNSTIDLTGGVQRIGQFSDGTGQFLGSLAEVWFTTTYIDISNSANRAKFIDIVKGTPIFLGGKGELPTGSQPLLYVTKIHGSNVANYGSGGVFTNTALTTTDINHPTNFSYQIFVQSIYANALATITRVFTPNTKITFAASGLNSMTRVVTPNTKITLGALLGVTTIADVINVVTKAQLASSGSTTMVRDATVTAKGLLNVVGEADVSRQFLLNTKPSMQADGSTTIIMDVSVYRGSLEASGDCTIDPVIVLTTDNSVIANALMTMLANISVDIKTPIFANGSTEFATSIIPEIRGLLEGIAEADISRSFNLDTKIELSGSGDATIQRFIALFTTQPLYANGQINSIISVAMTSKIEMIGSGSVTMQSQIALGRPIKLDKIVGSFKSGIQVGSFKSPIVRAS